LKFSAYIRAAAQRDTGPINNIQREIKFSASVKLRHLGLTSHWVGIQYCSYGILTWVWCVDHTMV